MSSIFGHTGNKGNMVDMSNALRHWLPDREAILQEADVSLGALELFNVPESPLTAQPFQYNEFIVVADCRIDNREELAKEFSFKENSVHADIEYIAFAYEKWGEECTHHLIGDFAFAVWDKKKKELFIARDHMGIKSVYYSIINNELIFASEIKGILAYPGYQKIFNEEYIVRLFSFAKYSTEFTLYQNIFLLKKGHSLLWKQGKYELKKYWTFGERTVKIPLTQKEQEEEFNRLFYLSVKDRLRTYKKLGAELSGGLDSTGIAAVAMETLGKGSELYSYSFGSPHQQKDVKDDSALIKEFCEKYEILKYWRVVNNSDITGEEILNLNHKIYDSYEANGVPSMTVSFLKSARENDIGVMLSGWAGDQVVTNTVSGFYLPLACKREYIKLWKDISRKHSTIKALIVFFRYAFKGRDSKLLYNGSLNMNRKKLTSSSLKEEIQNKYNLSNELSMGYSVDSATNIQEVFIEKMNLQVIEGRTIDHVLTGKHFNIEYRFPMLDIRLLEYIFSLPIDTIAPKGETRYLFKKAIAHMVPSGVIDIHKSKVPTTPFGRKFMDENIELFYTHFKNSNKGGLEKYIDMDKEIIMTNAKGQTKTKGLMVLLFLLEKLSVEKKRKA